MDVKNYYISHLVAIKIVNGSWYITKWPRDRKVQLFIGFPVTRSLNKKKEN